MTSPPRARKRKEFFSMAICSFFIMGIAAVCVQGAGMENVVLDNKHLAVTFEPSDAGPRLRTIEHRATGTTYRFVDSQEVTQEPRVEEVELGRLDHLLPDAAMPGGQAEANVACLQHRQPGPGRVM